MFGKGHRAWYINGFVIGVGAYITYGFVDWPSRNEWLVPKANCWES